MNLIEKLGGYEKAKDFINAASYSIDQILMMKKSGLRPLHVEKALLAYRREHGIFEVGDFVLPLSEHSDVVCELTEDYLGLDFKYKTKSGGFGYIVKSFMPFKWRHATDEEIAVGHRIESSNDQAISDCCSSNLDKNESQSVLSIKQGEQL